jgi:hypothetical protein
MSFDIILQYVYGAPYGRISSAIPERAACCLERISLVVAAFLRRLNSLPQGRRGFGRAHEGTLPPRLE